MYPTSKLIKIDGKTYKRIEYNGRLVELRRVKAKAKKVIEPYPTEL